jgi:hypothetical protein
MKKSRKFLAFLFVLLPGLCLDLPPACSAPIVYRQSVEVILRESKVTGWPPGEEDRDRAFVAITNSTDGSKIAFLVQCQVGNDRYQHLYVAKGNGSELADLTNSLPSGVNPNTLSSLALSNNGRRLFFRDPTIGVVTDIYYCNTDTLSCAKAVLPKVSGDMAILDHDFRKPFSIDAFGSQLFFRHNAGCNPHLTKCYKGLFTAPLMGKPSQILDIDKLPCQSECGNLGYVKFLGSSKDGLKHFFTYDHDPWHTTHPKSQGLWQVVGTTPSRVLKEDQDWVWPESTLYNQIVSADGGAVLYSTYSNKDLLSRIYVVNTAAKSKKLLGKTGDLNKFRYATLSPKGTFARFSGDGYLATAVDLATYRQRDSGSHCIWEFLCQYPGYGLSDFTGNDRYYYMAGNCDGAEAKVYRVDRSPIAFPRAPKIAWIRFSSNTLIADGTTRLTIMAKVQDAQGLKTIEKVLLHSLVEGLEYPNWMQWGEPVRWDDFGLYDDGTHGDAVARDGVFTNNTLRSYLDSSFYTKFTLPRNIGIRIVAKDKGGNYGIADTILKVVAP